MTIGQRIKSLRMTKSLSQEYVAISLGVSRQAVSKWETDAAVPDTYNLIALAKLFEVSVESIVSMNDESPAEEAVNERPVEPERKNNAGLLACMVSILLGIALVSLCYLGEQISNRFIRVYEMLALLPTVLSPLWMLFYCPESLAADKESLRRVYLRSLLYVLIAEVACALLFVGYYLSVYTFRLLEYLYYYIWPLIVLQFNMTALLNLSVLIPVLSNKRFGQPARIALYLFSTLVCTFCCAVFANLISSEMLYVRILIMLLGAVLSVACLVAGYIIAKFRMGKSHIA